MRIRAAVGAAVLAGAVLAAIAGCRSGPPPRYYTLDLKPSGTARPARAGIRVDRLTATEPLGRDGILIQKSPTEAEYYSTDRWLAPLEDLVAEKLAAEFGEPGDGRPLVLVDGTVRAFGQTDLPDGAEAHIRLDLAFRRPPMGHYEEPLLRKTYEARLRTEGTRAPAVVKALSKALEGVAVEIAADADRVAAAAGR